MASSVYLSYVIIKEKTKPGLQDIFSVLASTAPAAGLAYAMILMLYDNKTYSKSYTDPDTFERDIIMAVLVSMYNFLQLTSYQMQFDFFISFSRSRPNVYSCTAGQRLSQVCILLS